MTQRIDCRPGCAACCIAISISSPISGLPNGKPAGIRCPHLKADDTCRLHGGPDYPAVCRHFQADRQYCGNSKTEALAILSKLEMLTS